MRKSSPSPCDRHRSTTIVDHAVAIIVLAVRQIVHWRKGHLTHAPLATRTHQLPLATFAKHSWYDAIDRWFITTRRTSVRSRTTFVDIPIAVVIDTVTLLFLWSNERQADLGRATVCETRLHPFGTLPIRTGIAGYWRRQGVARAVPVLTLHNCPVEHSNIGNTCSPLAPLAVVDEDARFVTVTARSDETCLALRFCPRITRNTSFIHQSVAVVV